MPSVTVADAVATTVPTRTDVAIALVSVIVTTVMVIACAAFLMS